MTFLNPREQKARQRILRRREFIEGVLGNNSGNVYAGAGRYWVRVAERTDENGNTTYGDALPIRYSGESGIIERPGIEVLMQYDYDDVLTIRRVKPDYYDRAKLDSRVFNPLAVVQSWVYLGFQAVRLLTRPTGSDATQTSTLITIREHPFSVNDFLDWSIYKGTQRAAAKLDLASFIPAAGLQNLVVIFFDDILQTWFVTASDDQALTVPLDDTDYDECFAQLEHNEYKPLAAFNLADGQTKIDINDLYGDLRQFVNVPKIYGEPNPLPSGKGMFLRSTHQLIMYDWAIEGEAIIEGDMVIL